MAWCCQAPSHYLSQCWPRSTSPYDITRSQWVDINAIYSVQEIPLWRYIVRRMQDHPHLHNGNSFSGKTTSSYWISLLTVSWPFDNWNLSAWKDCLPIKTATTFPIFLEEVEIRKKWKNQCPVTLGIDILGCSNVNQDEMMVATKLVSL